MIKKELSFQNKRNRIGIMGGTFDPIHMGHLILAEKAYEQLALDQIWFMPSGNPPHKRNRLGRATDEQRVEMVRRGISGNDHFSLSLIEMHENGYTYTYHTLEELKEKNPDTDYFFIIGADSLFQFDTWMEPERICAACTLVVATRNHTSTEKICAKMEEVRQAYHGKLLRLDTMNIDVSSQMLREWISEGKSIRYYVPDSVIDYIREQKMYQDLRS
ncbi:MAG: nicotinate-nucleotide adenylyltransferase [Blautia sp.]|nr:nicotinate-nucleotide adenylyltransferase [Blautia sp.]MDY5031893.1 nicotinate-nucleotide adenylyltransferase [Blautia sp.]